MIPYRTLPEIVIGPLTIRVFGLAVALGVLSGAAVLSRLNRRQGVDVDVASLAVRLVVAGLVGARLAYVLGHPARFVARPWAVLFVWEGGLQFAGAAIAAGVALWRWLRAHPRHVQGVVVGGLAVAVPVGLAIGRLGCVAVGEHLGPPTSFFLATRYLGGRALEGPLTPGVAIHNPALYEAMGLALMAAALAAVLRRRPDPVKLAAAAAAWYGLQRFVTDFARSADARVAGLTAAQLGAAAVVFAAAAAWHRAATRRPPAFAAQPAPPHPPAPGAPPPWTP